MNKEAAVSLMRILDTAYVTGYRRAAIDKSAGMMTNARRGLFGASAAEKKYLESPITKAQAAAANKKRLATKPSLATSEKPISSQMWKSRLEAATMD
jgi:hypothetical protein